MKPDNKPKHTRVTIFINYLIISLFLFYAFFLVFYILRFNPSLNPIAVSLIFGPVMLDWVIGLLTIGSYRLLESLLLINRKNILCAEIFFFLILLNTSFLLILSLIYIAIGPVMIFFDGLLFFIIPLLYLKNIWFGLLFGTIFLKKNYTYTASAFLIVLIVLFLMGIIMDFIPNVDRVFLPIFSMVFFLSSISYFLFSGFFSLHFLRKRYMKT